MSRLLPGRPGAPPLILASSSPTRRTLLAAAGLAFEVEAAAVDEDEIKASMRAAGAPVRDTAIRLAEVKALRVGARRPGALVVGADQMLECEGAWFDKPADRPAAAAQLGKLSGRKHRLLSAVVAVENGARVWHHVGVAEMTVRELHPEFVAAYLDAVGDDAMSSVGAYRLEGLGAQLFQSIEGDYFTVLGMPLLPLLGFLRGRGIAAE